MPIKLTWTWAPSGDSGVRLALTFPDGSLLKELHSAAMPEGMFPKLDPQGQFLWLDFQVKALTRNGRAWAQVGRWALEQQADQREARLLELGQALPA